MRPVQLLVDDPKPLRDLIINIDFVPKIALCSRAVEDDLAEMRREISEAQSLSTRLGCRVRFKLGGVTWLLTPDEPVGDGIWDMFEADYRKRNPAGAASS